MQLTTALPMNPRTAQPTTAATERLDIPPPPAPPRVQWRRAWKAVRILIAEPDRTEMAFEAIAALSGRDWERTFQRFAADPAGRRLLVERPSLLSALSDRVALRTLPEGSFGRAYADFMDAAGLSAEGLVEAEAESMATEHLEILDPQREFVADRVRDMHDLWHVLTGYGRDEAGESANLAFSHAQTGLRGMALILFAIVLQMPPDGLTRREWLRYLVRAWKRGRRAAWLPVASYEELLAEPIESVRRKLGIEPASEAHPRGIIVFNGSKAASA